MAQLIKTMDYLLHNDSDYVSINMNVESFAEIGNVCRAAIRLANKLGVTIRFEFNETMVIAKPGDNPTELLYAWEKARQQGHGFEAKCKK